MARPRRHQGASTSARSAPRVIETSPPPERSGVQRRRARAPHSPRMKKGGRTRTSLPSPERRLAPGRRSHRRDLFRANVCLPSRVPTHRDERRHREGARPARDAHALTSRAGFRSRQARSSAECRARRRPTGGILAKGLHRMPRRRRDERRAIPGRGPSTFPGYSWNLTPHEPGLKDGTSEDFGKLGRPHSQ